MSEPPEQLWVAVRASAARASSITSSITRNSKLRWWDRALSMAGKAPLQGRNRSAVTTPIDEIGSGEGDRAIARVADNGAGIPENERERVFDRLHRANEPAFRSVPGTGLGLYISRQLAQGHGGSLVVESSTPGAGTTFALALPISVTAAPPALSVVGDSSEASVQMVAPTR